MTRTGRQGGFTLMEVMAAMLIFLTGVVGVLALFAGGLALHRDATHRAVVGQVSEVVRGEVGRLLEQQVDLLPGDDLPTPKDQEVPGYSGYFYTVNSFTADQDLGLEGGALATVYIYALDAGQKKGETFSFFIRPMADPEALIRAARRGATGARKTEEKTEDSGR